MFRNTDVDLDIIRFEDKIVFTVTHNFIYCVTVFIWLFEGCITQAIDDFEEFRETFYCFIQSSFIFVYISHPVVLLSSWWILWE